MTDTPIPPKPRSERYRPEITRLPEHNWQQCVIRWIFRAVCRLLVFLFIDLHADGLDRIPKRGPLLVVTNHLGDADFIIGIAVSPRPIDPFAKAELYDYKLLGKILDAYGIIWIHRGRPDRRALRVAIDGIRQGRAVAIAPEGRESLTGRLEEGTGGAAFLALKTNVPIMPVTVTCTENWRVFGNVKHLKRTSITLTIGPLFHLDPSPNLHDGIKAGTEKIMQTLACQLPPEYQGVYSGDMNPLEVNL